MVERVRFAIMFYIKRTKPTAQGTCPIYVRITVNGDRIEFSMNESINPDLWNSGLQRAYVSDQQGLELNESIQNVIDKLRYCKRQLEQDLKPVTAKNIRNLYFESDDNAVFLLQKFKEHNDRCEKLIGIDMRFGTLERYKTAYKHTKEFIWYKYKTNDILFVDVNYQFIRDFEYYLKTERKCAHNTTIKYLRNFQKIVKIGMANGWVKQNPFSNLKYKLHEVKTEFLDDTDLD